MLEIVNNNIHQLLMAYFSVLSRDWGWPFKLRILKDMLTSTSHEKK